MQSLSTATLVGVLALEPAHSSEVGKSASALTATSARTTGYGCDVKY